jgi:hypothetical protein
MKATSRRRTIRNPPAPDWLKWLRANARDPNPSIELPGSLGMLTGQDFRALHAIAGCWQLAVNSDSDGEAGALAAVRALLPALQPKCRLFARCLIPFAGDWEHIDRYWPRVAAADPVVPSHVLEARVRERWRRLKAAAAIAASVAEAADQQAPGHAIGCLCIECTDLQMTALERELSDNCACDEGHAAQCAIHGEHGNSDATRNTKGTETP